MQLLNVIILILLLYYLETSFTASCWLSKLLLTWTMWTNSHKPTIDCHQRDYQLILNNLSTVCGY